MPITKGFRALVDEAIGVAVVARQVGESVTAACSEQFQPVVDPAVAVAIEGEECTVAGRKRNLFGPTVAIEIEGIFCAAELCGVTGEIQDQRILALAAADTKANAAFEAAAHRQFERERDRTDGTRGPDFSSSHGVPAARRRSRS